jgi:hypothetical protein
MKRSYLADLGLNGSTILKQTLNKHDGLKTAFICVTTENTSETLQYRP